MKLKSEIFGITQPQRLPQTGDLLVVGPFLNEPYFKRSVILLIDHQDNEGSVGLILNRGSDIRLNQVLRGVTCPHEIPLYIGGPVEQGRLLYIHTLGDRIDKAVHLGSGLYIGGDFNDILLYLNSDEYDENCIKFFAGYCGWGIGQLSSEIKEKTWAVTHLANISDAMQAYDNSYWNKIVASLGYEYRAWLSCPTEPYLN